MKKRKILIGLVVIVTLVAAAIVVLVSRKNKNVPDAIKKAASDAATVFYSSESFPLKKGMYGEKIRIMQEVLILNGNDLGSYGADGKFGSKTLSAIQREYNDANKTTVTQAEWNVLRNIYDIYNKR